MAFYINRGGNEATTSQSSKSITRSRPWKPQAEQLKYQFAEGRRLYDAGPLQYYPGETVAGFDPAEAMAQQLREQRATAGSANLRAGQAGNLATASGAYLNANPYLDAMFERAAGNVGQNFSRIVAPGIAARYAQAGRLGSPEELAAGTRAYGELSGELSGLATDIYGTNYANERQLMEQAIRQSPAFAAADYMDIDQLQATGAERRTMEQAKINADRERFGFEQMEPWQRLQLLQGALGNPIPGVSTTTTTGETTLNSNENTFGLQPTNAAPKGTPWWQSLLSALL